MALFEEIRREYEHGIGSIAGVARQLGVHRRLVREALGSAVSTERPPAARTRPKTGPVTTFIDAILEADRRAGVASNRWLWHALDDVRAVGG